MSALLAAQQKFCADVAQLIAFGLARGDAFTFGDTLAHDGHMGHSLHYERLAIDLNLFVQGEWVRGDHEEWHALAGFWKSLGPRQRWGGDIVGKVDLNHFSAVPDDSDGRI